MVELEIDGKKVEVPEGSMVMHAASELGIYVPHFCYHKKLSIAANCRMCLVEVEKAPKPLPACATPVAAGMKVWTASEMAVKAQKGVMEFLLINHPLDCPICDQGGECQLQDLAVGYGASGSEFGEAKRVVVHKPMGPLISAEEMTRCIHCTRCIRFGQEIGGVMELGMANRGEFAEIMTFLGESIDSELSGNMIDICPVGALTSKPFRYTARTWELVRRKSVAPHDALGSNIIVQIKNDRVMRVVPLENEPVNECWISDRDRFSYEGLNSDLRLTAPMIKQDGVWQEVDWQAALNYAAHSLGQVRDSKGAAAIGALASPNSTIEELHLLGRLMRELGSDNIDFRLRQHDFSARGRTRGAPWLGMPIAEVGRLDRVLLVGSFLRKDHPLLAARVRHAVKHGAQVSVLHAADDNLLMPLAAREIVAPSAWAGSLAGILVAVLQSQGKPVPAGLAGITASDAQQAMAASLLTGERKAVFLGNAAVQSDRAGLLAQLAQALADATGAQLGFLGEAANSVGGWLVGALPGAQGHDAAAMVEQPLAAYLLLGTEPAFDHGMPGPASAALAAADTVIALSSFRTPELLAAADCLLPIAPFTETAGSFVNCEGRLQKFNGVTRPRGSTRPGWKVLRVLGNLLDLPGFEYDTAESVRIQALSADFSSRLDNRVEVDLEAPELIADATTAAGTLERLADVPIYAVDPLVRQAPSLQRTQDARAPRAQMNSATMTGLALIDGDRVRITLGGGEAVLKAALDETVAAGVVRIATAHESTAGLARMFGAVSVTRV